MIAFDISDTGILTVTPMAPLQAEDFHQIAAAVDAWLESGNRLKGLLIDAPQFPGWHDFHALLAHFKFVTEHHRQIPRVAIVSDTTGTSLLPNLAKHFVNAELKHFPAAERDEALGWLA